MVQKVGYTQGETGLFSSTSESAPSSVVGGSAAANVDASVRFRTDAQLAAAPGPISIQIWQSGGTFRSSTTGQMYGINAALTQYTAIGSGAASALTSLPNTITGSFSRWQAAKARGAANPAKFLMLGDSNKVGAGAGSGGTTALNGAMALGMSRKFANLGSMRIDSFYCDQNISGASGGQTYTAYDPRVVLGSGWTSSTSGGTCLGAHWFTSAAANAAQISFTPDNAFDKFIVQAITSTGGNNGMRVFVDGTQVGTINELSGTSALSFPSFTVARGTHTISIDANGAGTAYVLGIQTYDSTSAAPIFIQAGWWGGVAANAASNTFAWDSIKQITALAPDFTCLQLTINDSAGLGTTAGTPAQMAAYYAAMELIVSTAAATSDGCIEVGYPYGQTGATRLGATSGDYDIRARMMQDLARTYGWSFIDLRDTFGYSNIIASARGYYFDDSHPSLAGHTAVAAQEYNFLHAAGL